MNDLFRPLATLMKRAGTIPRAISGLVLFLSAGGRNKWHRDATALPWALLAAILLLANLFPAYGTQGPGGPLLAAVLPSGFFRKPETLRSRPLERDRVLFEQNCTLCHTGELVFRRTRGWNRDRIRSALDHLNRLNPAMPDYKGTAREKDRLADFIYRMSSDSPRPDEQPRSK